MKLPQVFRVRVTDSGLGRPCWALDARLKRRKVAWYVKDFYDTPEAAYAALKAAQRQQEVDELAAATTAS